MPKKGRPKKTEKGGKFKPGHRCLYNRQDPGDASGNFKESSVPYAKRLPYSVFHDAVRETPDSNSYTVRDADGNLGNMRFLRPYPESEERDVAPPSADDAVVGNKILHTGHLLHMFNECRNIHKAVSADCEGNFEWNPRTCQKWGFGWRLGLKCDSCQFQSKKYKLYDETATDEPRKQGPKAAKINIGVHVGLMSTSVGAHGLRGIMLSSGVPVPSKSGMQKNANKVAETVTALNQQDMMERRKKLTELNQIRGFTESTQIGLAGDARYNNRADASDTTPFQRGTQITYTMTETETKSQQIVGIYTGNKLCKAAEYHARSEKKTIQCPDHPGTCTANLRPSDSIGDEFRAAAECAREFASDEKPVNIGYFTTDGDSRACAGLQSAQSQYSGTHIHNLRDTRHFSQSLKKKIQSARFSQKMFPGTTKAARDTQQRHFAIDLKSRCHTEYRNAHKLLAGDLQKLKNKLQFTTEAVLDCATGNCGQTCRRHSFVCSGGKRKGWKRGFLSPDIQLDPTVADKQKLRELIGLRLGDSGIEKTKLNTNTQKCESVNRAYTKTNPKSVTYYRLFPARIHSAAHILNTGFSQAIRRQCEASGASIADLYEVVIQLKQMERQMKYHAARKLSVKYLKRQGELRRMRYALHAKLAKNRTVTYKKGFLDPEMRTLKSTRSARH